LVLELELALTFLPEEGKGNPNGTVIISVLIGCVILFDCRVTPTKWLGFGIVCLSLGK